MKRILTVAIVLALLAPSAAFAVTGTIQATANVLNALTVSNNLRTLDFGDVFPGAAKSIAFSDATSGKWQIDGELNAEVQMSFTLPAALTQGANNLPISFGVTDAGYFATDAVFSAVQFDPNTGTTDRLDAAAGTGFVWLGGTVTPGAVQAPGIYNAVVSLDVVYTGN